MPTRSNKIMLAEVNVSNSFISARITFAALEVKWLALRLLITCQNDPSTNYGIHLYQVGVPCFGFWKTGLSKRWTDFFLFHAKLLVQHMLKGKKRRKEKVKRKAHKCGHSLELLSKLLSGSIGTPHLEVC